LSIDCRLDGIRPTVNPVAPSRHSDEVNDLPNAAGTVGCREGRSFQAQRSPSRSSAVPNRLGFLDLALAARVPPGELPEMVPGARSPIVITPSRGNLFPRRVRSRKRAARVAEQQERRLLHLHLDDRGFRRVLAPGEVRSRRSPWSPGCPGVPALSPAWQDRGSVARLSPPSRHIS
jgi:hypothetical protein